MSFLMGTMGNYERPRRFDAPGLIIANSFGTDLSAGSVNAAIKALARKYARETGAPVVMDIMVANAFGPDIDGLTLIVSGPISDIKGAGVGTWGVLVRANEFMMEHGFTDPMIIGHGCHVNRIVLQAIKLGMDPIVPVGLPLWFDADSKQVWTRSLALWVPREVIGSFVLKRQGRL